MQYVGGRLGGRDEPYGVYGGDGWMDEYMNG